MDEYKNTIYENFFGQSIQVTKLVDQQTQKEKIISSQTLRMGPIMLESKQGRLTEAWEDATRDLVEDYKTQGSEVCVNETWVKDPPNILIFNINRVSYDKEKNALVKDFSKFEFEKKIYADQFIDSNISKVKALK